MKLPTGPAELLATIEESRAEVARLTTLAIRRAMNPELHRDALEAARDAERAAMEALSKAVGHRAKALGDLTFADLVQSMNDRAQTTPGESNEPA